MTGVRTVRVGDIQVACREDGPADRPPVLLAHGLLTSHRMWDGLVSRLQHRWRVVRYDLRGHGGTSAPPAPYSMEQLADDAAGLLDALGIEQAHFIGSSLGGMLGQQLAIRHARRISTLTLANTTGVQAAPAAWTERIAIAQERGVGPLVEPTMQRWFTPSFLAAAGEPVQRMRSLAQATSAKGFAGCAEAVRRLDHGRMLDRIDCPTLVIVGEHDAATPPNEGRALQAAITGAGLASLSAAHQSAVECPQVFAEAWLSFALVQHQETTRGKP